MAKMVSLPHLTLKPYGVNHPGRPKIRALIGLADIKSCSSWKFELFDAPLSSLNLSSTPQFHTDPLSSTQGPHIFSTQNPSVQHQKPLSSTPYTSLCWKRGFWCGTGGCGELTGFSCGTDGCGELRDFGVELRNFWGGKAVALLC